MSSNWQSESSVILAFVKFKKIKKRWPNKQELDQALREAWPNSRQVKLALGSMKQAIKKAKEIEPLVRSVK